MVCLGITVSSFSTDVYLLDVFQKFLRILREFFIMALLYALMVSSAAYELRFIELPYSGILFGSLFYVFRCVFRVDAELHPCEGQLFIDLSKKMCDLVKQTVS